jgi:hypothetical protein
VSGKTVVVDSPSTTVEVVATESPGDDVVEFALGFVVVVASPLSIGGIAIVPIRKLTPFGLAFVSALS